MANSVFFAKKNGCRIDLYTDNAGMQLFSFLPYDNIYRALETLEVTTAFWAAGKIKAHESAPLGHIQIDYDVYLKGKQCVDMLEYASRHFDLVAENHDCEYSQSTYYEKLVKEARKLLPSGIQDVTHFDVSGLVYAYTCGLVGFMSQELKSLYCHGYKQVTQAFANSPLFAARDKTICLDLIAEQAFLKMCQTKLGSSDITLLNQNWGLQQNNSSAHLGYVHLSYLQKYEEHIIKVNEDMLRIFSPTIFSIIRDFK